MPPRPHGDGLSAVAIQEAHCIMTRTTMKEAVRAPKDREGESASEPGKKRLGRSLVLLEISYD